MPVATAALTVADLFSGLASALVRSSTEPKPRTGQRRSTPSPEGRAAPKSPVLAEHHAGVTGKVFDNPDGSPKGWTGWSADLTVQPSDAVTWSTPARWNGPTGGRHNASADEPHAVRA